MYFKATKGTMAFEKITGFWDDVLKQRKQNTKDLQSHIGIPFKEQFLQKNLFSLCGKITSIKPSMAVKRGSGFSAAQVKLNLERDWVVDEYAKSQGHEGFYRPNFRRKTGRAIAEFIRSQKDYSYGDENKIFGLKVSMERWAHFGYVNKKNFVLIDTQDDLKNFKPIEGMIEITITEYKKLKGKND